ncbi:MAG: hypothetical protein ABIL25_00150 [candidate division WOR-3 bacterium]
MKWIVMLFAAGLIVSSLAQPDTARWVSHYNGVDGWFAFQGPQRAMDLDPSEFGLAHPVQVESLKTWWYWGMGSWTDSVFTFRIYGGDGQTLLWESESLTAPRTYWTHYGLAQPVRIDTGKFYIATTHRRVDSYAHPYVNVDSSSPIHSFYGTPGNWTRDNVGEFCFFAFVRELGTGAKEGRWTDPARELPGPTFACSRILIPGRSRMALFDALGRRLGEFVPGENDAGNLRAGTYFVIGQGRTTKVVLTGN